MTYSISANLVHNASLTIFNSHEGIVEVLEIERFTNKKNDGIFWDDNHHSLRRQEIIKKCVDYFKNKYGVNLFEKVLLNRYEITNIHNIWNIKEEYKILEIFSSKEVVLLDHQFSHACGGYYQSNFDECTIITADSGGNDGNFNIFKASKDAGVVQIGKIHDHVIGHRYAYFGNFCSSIRKEKTWHHFGELVYAGKLMGLAGYGSVVEEWIEPIYDYYTGYNRNDELEFNELKSKLNWPDEFSGQLEKDIIATSQFVFEKKFIDLTKEYIEGSKNIIIAGGCGLNILNNQKVLKDYDLFIPPNPNDSGLSMGQALAFLQPKDRIRTPFLGPRVWDENSLMEYVVEYDGKKIDDELIAQKLIEGKIIGVVKGRSEIGPRALGNRSILCYAPLEGMKDTLNKKVKNREPFRPFAPVCRIEDSHKYFDTMGKDYSLMTFSPDVNLKYRDDLKEVTHIDGSARLQTVDESSYLYNILNLLRIKNPNSPPVLINTSFNVAGKPILNSFKDAIKVWTTTEMDGLILEDYYFEK